MDLKHRPRQSSTSDISPPQAMLSPCCSVEHLPGKATDHTPHISFPAHQPDSTNTTLSSIPYDYDGPQGHEILRLKPSREQWADFPRILQVARHLKAPGCFKVVIPKTTVQPLLPTKKQHALKCHSYKIRQIKRNSFWQVNTVPAEGVFDPEHVQQGGEPTVHDEIARLKKLFLRCNGKRMRNVLYRVDVPAWTEEQRRCAGVPAKSPIHPLKGDRLNDTRAIIPGIHVPYVYESASEFGSTFQIHAEDYRLVSLNHLYMGRKIWIVVPSVNVDLAEQVWGRKHKCSQFMRHRAEFFFPDKLDKLGIPYNIIDQRAGETMVILPDAYHQGFSTGYTLAEAKNYADSSWSTEQYQACDEKCMLLTAIPPSYMHLLENESERIDLCATYSNEDIEPKADEDGNDATTAKGALCTEASSQGSVSAPPTEHYVETSMQSQGRERPTSVEYAKRSNVEDGFQPSDAKRIKV